MRRFVVVTCVRNTAAKLEACLRSIAEQQYLNFTVVVVDDASTDSSREVAALWCDREGWTLIARDERVGAVKNQWDAIHAGCVDPDDVIVWVDGDDRLAGPDTFQILDRYYQNGALLTYGSYRPEPPDKGCAPARPYPSRVIRRNAYRTAPERHSYNHLRTMTYGLFSQIDETDCLDDRGEWFTSTPDAVFMFPALELARGRIAFVPEVLLVYSSDLPSAEWRNDPKAVNYVNRTVLPPAIEGAVAVKIWVVVPVYNRADLFAQCVESLAEQDDPDFQVVVADDASTDRGIDSILQRLGPRYGWTVVRRNKNIGATLNIRKAIHHIQTSEDMPADDVILLVDGDDRLTHPDSIAVIREAFTPDVDVVYGSYIAEPPDDGCPPARPIPPDILSYGMIRAFTRDHGPYYNHPLAFRRRVYDVLRDDDFQGADGEYMKYGYDTTLMVPILEAAGERVRYLDAPLYVYTADRAEAVHRMHTEANQAENWWVTSQPRKYQPIEVEAPCESA